MFNKRLKIDLQQDLFQDDWVDWLGQDLIHAAANGSADIILFSVACNSQNDWLRDIEALQVAPYLVTRLIAIHNGHVAVHQDQSVRSLFLAVGLNVLHYFFIGLQPIQSDMTNSLRVLELDRILEYDHCSIDVEVLVVYHQDLLFAHFLMQLLHLVLELHDVRLGTQGLVAISALGLPLEHKVALVQTVEYDG